MAKKLVINADDYGLSDEINARIMRCRTEGAVTDISFLATGDSFEHATLLAKENNINKIGIHLALTGSFKPVSPAESISTLVNRNSVFPGSYRSFLARYFLRIVSLDEIYTEFKNQLLKIKDKGFKITHLDSHEHIHMIPGIFKIIIRLVKEEGIQYVRFPLERMSLSAKLKSPQAVIRNILLSRACNLSAKILSASGVKHNDNFIGHAHALKVTRNEFISAISGLKEGLTELCCHPGAREEERAALCDKSFTDELKKHAVELMSY